jgi:hypothetical protein
MTMPEQAYKKVVYDARDGRIITSVCSEALSAS